MNFHQWKSRMRNLQIQTGPAFEDVLLRHFQQCKNEVKRNPTLQKWQNTRFSSHRRKRRNLLRRG